MLEHETLQQGSFEIDPDQGAFIVPEAPQPDTRSDLRRGIIDPGIEEGATIQRAVMGGRERDQEPLNAIQANTGYNGEVAVRALPSVVARGYAPLLQRVVESDRDIELQQSIIDQMQRERDHRERARMDEVDRQNGLDHISALHDIMDPDRSKRHKEAARQAAVEADAAKRRMPPPDISKSA